MKIKYFIEDDKEVSLKKFTESIIDSTLQTILNEIEEGIEIETGYNIEDLPIEDVLCFFADEVKRELFEIGFAELQECGQWQDFRIEKE